MPSATGTPKPTPLTGSDTNSFAYPTLKDRVPVIICKVIDLLHRGRHALELTHDTVDLKNIIEKMAQLRYELQTNKPLTPITDGRDDQDVWNNYLKVMTEEEGSIPRWFNTRWLYAECYAYRRLWQSMAESKSMRDFDIFKSQKQDAFFDSLSAIRVLAKKQNEIVSNLNPSSSDWESNQRRQFISLLQLSLWGNKCDLSISAGANQAFSAEPLEQVLLLKKNLLVDQSELVWDLITKNNQDKKIVDIVMDNAGFELFTDLCLADYIISSNLSTSIRLRVKVFPWFVSDTTVQDIDWVLDKLKDGAVSPVSGDGKNDSLRSEENDADLAKLEQRWRHYITSGKWEIHSDPYWTYPHDYSLLRSECPTLYSSLSEAGLIIFKGDLNYRKLVGDLNWEPTVEFSTALQGFHPAPLVALRTLKADVVTGLKEGQASEVAAQDPKWMVNGEWGLIQVCSKIV